MDSRVLFPRRVRPFLAKPSALQPVLTMSTSVPFHVPDNHATSSRTEDQTTRFVLRVLVDHEVLSPAQQRKPRLLHLRDVTVHRTQERPSNPNHFHSLRRRAHSHLRMSFCSHTIVAGATFEDTLCDVAIVEISCLSCSLKSSEYLPTWYLATLDRGSVDEKLAFAASTCGTTTR